MNKKVLCDRCKREFEADENDLTIYDGRVKTLNLIIIGKLENTKDDTRDVKNVIEEYGINL